VQHDAIGCCIALPSLSAPVCVICMSPISISSCDETLALDACMGQAGMSCIFGQNAAASTWLQPLKKSREMTQMSRSLFIEN
jgi:hypothetical protein